MTTHRFSAFSAFSAFGGALAAVLLSCASDAAPGPGEGRRGTTRAAIIAGTPSDATQNEAVMLVYSDPATRTRDICTATLVAPRLVLTARHCVADTDADVACNAAGQPVRGGVVRADHDPRKLFVFTGTTRPVLDAATWKPAGQGIEVIDDGSGNLCNHDLALVLLERPIEGVPLAALRLDESAAKGEALVTIGWGVTETTPQPAVRMQRAGVRVTRTGPDDADPALTPSEFTFGESICLGDSGGPLLSQATGAVLGVVSRGGNGTSSDTDLSASCIAATTLGTNVAPFRELVTGAFAKAGAMPLLEVKPPSPPAPSGGCHVATEARGARAPGLPAGSLALIVLVLAARSARGGARCLPTFAYIKQRTVRLSRTRRSARLRWSLWGRLIPRRPRM